MDKKRNVAASLPDLLAGVRAKRDDARRLLYLLVQRKHFPKMVAYISRQGGAGEDAEDLFQEAVLAFFRAVETEKFRLRPLSGRSYTGQIGAFLMATVKNLWRKELRWRSRPPVEPDAPLSTPGGYEILPGQVSEALLELNVTCRERLGLFFVRKKTAAVIANELELPTATVKKELKDCIAALLAALYTRVDAQNDTELLNIVNDCIEEMDEKCRLLLTAFYREGQDWKTIAEQLGYSSDHSAAEQKRKCMVKLNRAVAAKLLAIKS